MSNLNQSLLSELTTGIVILDSSLRVKFINSSALTILDTTEKSSLKQKLDQIFFEEPESLDSFTEALNQKRSFTKTDAVLNLKRGSKVLCTYIVHPFTDEKETGLLLEIINKEASSELIERYRMRTNQQISQDFVRGLAHEIKNPLSGIRGSAQLLRNKFQVAFSLNFHFIFYFFVLISVLLIFYQTYLIKDFDSTLCLKAFKNNNWLGLSIFIGSILGVSL